ncbi:acyl carrier protein [Streptomyces sp. NPDC001941]|uniref:acyl carrier protein n=1 Tax=Streptomyces sp. NPDC001941 TaxID=3154659 RepID=UPI00332D3C31
MAEIRALFTELLGADVPGDGSFIGHGGDSFHAVVVVSRIEERWGVEVDFLDVLDSTPDTLTATVNTARAAARTRA